MKRHKHKACTKHTRVTPLLQGFHLVPAGDAPMPSHMESEVDLVSHMRSNAVMRLEVVCALWTHGHSVLPACALTKSSSKVLLDHLVSTISSTHIPTGASATHAAGSCSATLMPHPMRLRFSGL